MTIPADPIPQPERLILLEKTVNDQGESRWQKRLSVLYPAAGYWLCHEARILQEFQRDQRHAGRFVALDLDRLELRSAAHGHPLTHWLATPCASIDHPFQRSSELLRLVLACLQALESLHHRGIVHGGLRPDCIMLDVNAAGELDYDRLSLVDFAYAHGPQLPLEKPLFIDVDSPDAASMAPWYKAAVSRDWQRFAIVAGERNVRSWYELSPAARRQYERVRFSELAVSQLDWRVDLYSLGYWFRQIALHRVDFCTDKHQETLPRLFRRMQKPLLQGGFPSVAAAIQAFSTLVQATPPLRIASQPHTARVQTMHPAPAIQLGSTGEIEFAPETLPLLPSRRPASSSLPWLLGGGAALLASGLTFSLLLQYSAPQVQLPVVHSAAATLPLASNPQMNPAAVVAAPSPSPSLAPPQPQPQPQPAVPAAKTEAAPANPVTATAPDLDDPQQLRAAAEAGNAVAQTRMGLAYRRGQGVAQDNDEAVRWYRKAAEQNDAEAQAYLGFMYMTAKGVPHDDEQAVHWLQRSARQGNALGQYNLGLLRLHGRGGPANRAAAYALFLLARDKEPSAKLRLDELTPVLPEGERITAERMAKEGGVEAAR